MLRKLLGGVAVAGLIVSAMVFARPVASQAAGPHKVTICHFAGHQGDFVTNNWITIGNPVCDREGGNNMVVAPSGCENGHNAITRFGRSCDQGANQAGAPAE